MNDDLIPVNKDVSANVARATQEVQAQIIIAQKFPRDINKITTSILEACKRKSLADGAIYTYPKGKKKISGETIRLMEVIALSWTNLKYGVEQISKTRTDTEYRVYAWDLQTNVNFEMFFSQKHARWTKDNGLKDMSGGDPRDEYELVMSNASRRLRSCLKKIIPPYIVEEARNACIQTIKDGYKGVPIGDTIRKMVASFKDLGVTQEMIIKKIGHNLDSTNEIELVSLHSIYTSLKDNMGKVTDFFDYDEVKKEKLNADYKDPPPAEGKDPEEKTLSFPEAITNLVNCKDTDQLMFTYGKINDMKWTDKQLKDIEKTHNDKEKFLNKDNK